MAVSILPMCFGNNGDSNIEPYVNSDIFTPRWEVYITECERIRLEESIREQARIEAEQVRMEEEKARIKEEERVQAEEDARIRAEEKKFYIESIPLTKNIQKFIKDESKESNLNYFLILAIIKCESDFKTNDTSYNKNGTYDTGLMQVNSSNKAWANELVGRELNLKNPKDNIEAGISIFNHYYSYWERKGYSGRELLLRGLNSYNMGINGLKKYMSRGNDYDDWYYGNKILKNMNKIKSRLE